MRCTHCELRFHIHFNTEQLHRAYMCMCVCVWNMSRALFMSCIWLTECTFEHLSCRSRRGLWRIYTLRVFVVCAPACAKWNYHPLVWRRLVIVRLFRICRSLTATQCHPPMGDSATSSVTTPQTPRIRRWYAWLWVSVRSCRVRLRIERNVQNASMNIKKTPFIFCVAPVVVCAHAQSRAFVCDVQYFKSHIAFLQHFDSSACNSELRRCAMRVDVIRW